MYLALLEDTSLIKEVSSKYIKNLIESGNLEIFLEEKTSKIYSNEVQKNAYTIKLLNSLKTTHFYITSDIENSFNYILDKNQSRYISAKKCINTNGIYLSEEEKNEIRVFIKEKVIDGILNQANAVSKNLAQILTMTNLKSYNQYDIMKKIKKEISDKLFFEEKIDRLYIRMDDISQEEEEKMKGIRILLILTGRIFEGNMSFFEQIDKLNEILNDKDFLENNTELKNTPPAISNYELILKEAKELEKIDLEKITFTMEYKDIKKAYTLKDFA